MNKKKLIALLFAGIMSFAYFVTPISNVEAAPSTISEYDSLISELKTEEQEITKKLNALKADIAKNEAESIEIANKIEETQNVLENLKAEIEALRMLINQRSEHANKAARSVQIMGSANNIVDFLLGADSIDEVFNRIDVVSTLVRSNQDVITQQQEDKNLVEAKEAEMALVKEEQETLAQNLAANKKELEANKGEQETVLAKISSKKAVAVKERATLVEKIRAAEAARRVQVASSQSYANTGSVTASSSNASAPIITSSGGWVRPASGGYVSSRYGFRSGFMHRGIDIADRSNGGNGAISILAAKSGTVTTAGYHYSYGNYVVINHGSGLSTLYAHMQGNLGVSSGQSVSAGQRIGTMGSTGDSTGHHLHFEILENGNRVNPEKYMSF